MSTPRIKVLHVVEAFSSGVFEMVRQIADAQVAAGDEVHIAHAQRPWTPDGFELLFPDGVVFHRLRWGVRRTVPSLVRGTAQLARLIRDERPDLVHLHSTLAGIAGAVVLPRGIPSIYTPNGYIFLMSSLSGPARTLARITESGVGRRVSLVGAVSQAEAEQARGLGLEHVRVIHNGVRELDRLTDPARRCVPMSGRVGVAASGRMSAQRMPLAVAEIFDSLPPAVRRVWVGDSDLGEAEQAIRRSGASITGWLPRRDALELIGGSRVYLHWTAWDGHPLSVLEAIGAGTVVVAHDIPPVREILGHRWVHATTAEATRMIERLLVDDDLYARAQEDQARAAAPFSGRAMSDRWCGLYTELAASGAGAGAHGARV